MENNLCNFAPSKEAERNTRHLVVRAVKNGNFLLFEVGMKWKLPLSIF